MNLTVRGKHRRRWRLLVRWFVMLAIVGPWQSAVAQDSGPALLGPRSGVEIAPAKPTISLPDLRALEHQSSERMGASLTGQLVPSTDSGAWDDHSIEVPKQLMHEVPKLERFQPAAYKPDLRDLDELHEGRDDVSPKQSPSLEPPSLSPADNEETQAPQFRWPEPKHILEITARLKEVPNTADWAKRVEGLVAQLQTNCRIGSPSSEKCLQDLEVVLSEAKQHASQMEFGWNRTDLTQAHYGLIRRLDLWKQAQQIVAGQVSLDSPSASPEQVQAKLEAVEEILRTGGRLLSWSDYLQLSDLRTAIQKNQGSAALKEAADAVLSRLESNRFDDSQQKLLSQPAFVEFATSLRATFGIHFDPQLTLGMVERYESSQAAHDAKQLALQANLFQHHQSESIQAFGKQLDQSYRNANMRLEVHRDFMQAFLPTLEPDEKPVDDYILGNRVFGRSRIQSELVVFPVPDNKQWRVQLEVNGNVDSRTSSSSGPVTIFNRGRSRYRAAKQVMINADGFWVSKAVARAETSTSLDNMETDYDGVPLIGSMIRSMARNQTESQKPAADREVQLKVRRMAQDQLNEELNEKVQAWQDKLHSKVLHPLTRFGLEPTIVDMQTSAEKVQGRFRTAGLSQLAAHTPRPSAPLNSVLNAQIHQTAINNMVRKMGFGGRDLTPDQLLTLLSAKFAAPKRKMDEDLPMDIVFRFDEDDPIRVNFEDGMVQLILKLETLRVDSKTWRDLEISAHYAPTSIDWNAEFVRESTVSIHRDRRLSFRDQIALRGIFLKVLSKGQTLRLFPEKAVSDLRLKSFELNQLAIHEGWLALSLGRKQTEPPKNQIYRVTDQDDTISR